MASLRRRASVRPVTGPSPRWILAAAALLCAAACGEPAVDLPPGGGGGAVALDAGFAGAKDATTGPSDGGGGGASDSGVSNPMGCEAPRRQCGSRCVNVLTHPEHCGDCNQPCTGGSFCDDGMCARTCAAGLRSCGGACVDVAADRDHCGDCDRPCARDQECRGGRCQCPEGYIECGGECVDPETSSLHCGVCMRTCDADEFCGGGTCQCAGGSRETDCNDGDDEDCDGLIDCRDPDCIGETRGCTGACGPGSQSCQMDGTWAECTGGDGSPEICGDGIDQDCNGSDLRNPDEWEPNDSCGQCAQLTATVDPNVTIRPRIDSVDDGVDCFYFDVSDDINFGFPERIRITLENIPANADYDLYLYRGRSSCDARMPLASSDASGAANESIDWQEVFNSDDGGRYYIRVVRFRGHSCTMSYSLSVNGLN
jgi:hypothetical protein